MKHSTSIAVLAEALAKAQAEIKDITKSAKAAEGTKNEYDYATLPDILKEIRRVFSKNGLSFTQSSTHTGGEIYEYQTKYGGKKKAKLGGDVIITGLLMHKSGEWIEYEGKYPSLITFNMNEAQAVGASIAYARKYQILSVAGIAGEEDTDANDVPAERPVQKQKTAVEPDKPAKQQPKKQGWLAGFLKTMNDMKAKLGDEDYYSMLSEYADVKHANEIKSKEVAQKVYKVMAAKVKLEENKKKLKDKENEDAKS